MIATLKTMLVQKSALSKWSLHGLNAGLTVLTLVPFLPPSLESWRASFVWGGSIVTLAGAGAFVLAYRRAKRV